VDVAGLPLWQRSVLALIGFKGLTEVVVVCPTGREDQMEPLLKSSLPSGIKGRCIPGGVTRTESARKAREFLLAVPPENVAIHDGARPCVFEWEWNGLLEAMGGEGVDGAILASPIADTLWKAQGSQLAETYPRQQLLRALTPQMFSFSAWCEALSGEGEATDDASMVKEAGFNVVWVRGSEENRKVTWPEDLEWATRRYS